MATPTTVTYGLDTPAGAARAGVSVTAVLCGAGDRSDIAGVVGGVASTTTAEDGTFSLQLLPNSAYQQTGTYYAVNIAGGPSYNIVVPVESPVDLWDIRVDPATLAPVPATTPPMYLLRTERGIAGGVAGLDVNGLVPEDQLPASSGGSGVPTTREINTSNGLQGGGNLTANRTLSPVYGSTSGTICQGNDLRLSDPRTPLDHGHVQGDVVGLVTALAGKEATGTAAAAVAAHEAASDPHPQYLTSAEGGAAYAAASHTHTINNVTGLQTALDGKVPAALVDGKGDLIVATAADTLARLAVGSDGQVLTADSAQTAGVKWAPPAGGSSGEQEVYGPAAAGFGEWSCDPLICTTNYPTASGTLFLVRHRFRSAMTIDEIGCALQQAGTVPGSYSGVAVYADGTGTVAREAQSADAGSSFTSIGLKSIALTAGVAVTAGAFKWIGYLWQGSTPPRLYAPPGPADAAVLNYGRRRSVTVSGQTAFPSSVDIAAATVNSTSYWFTFKDV